MEEKMFLASCIQSEPVDKKVTIRAQSSSEVFDYFAHDLNFF